MTERAAPDKSPDRIASMFDAIAPRYDFLNHLLSAGIDRDWRAKAIESLQLSGGETLVDVCAGTADVALEARRRGASRVVGVDFAGAMLMRGWHKVLAAGEADHVTLVRGDATRLPIQNARVDAATLAFGIRNVQQPDLACAEIARVLRPGGRLAILEFGIPNAPGIRSLYRWYFTRVLPTIGRLVSGHTAAYSYLPTSVGTFASPEEFVESLRKAGFNEVRTVRLTLGVVYLYTARR